MSEWDPDEIVIKRPRPWVRVLTTVIVIVAAVGGLWFFREELIKMKPPPVVARANHVRSEVVSTGDSLEVVVTWQLVDSAGMPQPDSVRLEVGLEGTDPKVSILPAQVRSDTLRIGAPGPGVTAMGHSCVTGVYGSRLSGESCTPWQFVRPSADAVPPAASDTGKIAHGGTTPVVLHLVVRPSGQQVDPDVGGKCAAWQRSNPRASVWVEVNHTAVPPCMGPNGKPTVAQFCAFAILDDGKRVKAANSMNNPYCDVLYHDWVRERLT